MEMAQTTPRTFRLGERRRCIRATSGRPDQRRNRVPAMGFEQSRGGVVPCHRDDIWVECHQGRDQSISFFNDVYFGVKVAILTVAIFLVGMELEEIIAVEVLLQRVKLTGYGVTGRQEVHAHQFGDAPVHGVARNSPAPQLEDVSHLG